MNNETAEKIEKHLESIAESLRAIAERTPSPHERRLEGTHNALLVNTGKEPTLPEALSAVKDLEVVLTGGEKRQP